MDSHSCNDVGRWTEKRTPITLAMTLALVVLTGCELGVRQYRYGNPHNRNQQMEQLNAHLPASTERKQLADYVMPRVVFLVCGNLQDGFDPSRDFAKSGRAAAITTDGYFLTANHLVDKRDCFIVETQVIGNVPRRPMARDEAERFLKTQVFPGRVVWQDQILDLAIVKFELHTEEYFEDLTHHVEPGTLLYSADDVGRGFVPVNSQRVSKFEERIGNDAYEVAGTVIGEEHTSLDGRVVLTSIIGRGGLSGAPVVTRERALAGIMVSVRKNSTLSRSVQTKVSMISPEQIHRIIGADRNQQRRGR